MRLQNYKKFPKSKPKGYRDYVILLFRFLIAQHKLLVFLRYDGDPTALVFRLRYLAAANGVKVILLNATLLRGIFTLPQNFHFLSSRVFMLYSHEEGKFLNFLNLPSFEELLDLFPFIALCHGGFFSQEPTFAYLRDFTKLTFFTSSSICLQCAGALVTYMQAPILHLLELLALLPFISINLIIWNI